ncbi:MAG: S-adenosylmethionine decarboxylase [Candidatus Thermoplasmatota archaeon]|jgi:S-adenosylmethionine decarboxylase|nr:S-adenosylmethionine decarboxylase [Candidatus Thermoplasmatota archaeon]MEC7410202.1 S-adenosylmethionine decarboxylase [Candidatus Thermoplasmatota archaeon]MEC7532061.1 S-adenosylmethionine decarboxylase [Candidatus Thermoplasmatota archaeon]MEC9137465.1 S-adenosylmethionine decarboxylase [Candidatus Thermoplasmatota archaeon]MEC9199942.1 S-adenosylmethionine decarboxylase [Candidatus Thermoplasmatota archaeon]|tara:strand:+ start:1903 stop:2277 length:375 start_codon:yes stop_codon:yes gene_type:complete
MVGGQSRGTHVLLDYRNYSSTKENDGQWMLNLMRESVRKCGIREVHSHVEIFDGDLSPPGFAAVVLIDESHVTAHCYSESGLLAIDVFTCGDHEPDCVAEQIHERLVSENDRIVLDRRQRIDRF